MMHTLGNIFFYILAVVAVKVQPAAIPSSGATTITEETWGKCFTLLQGYLKERMSIPSFGFQFEPEKNAKIWINANVSDVEIEHANNFTVEIARVDLNKLNFVVTTVFPRLNLIGHYVAQANGSLYLNGNGTFSVYATKFLLHLNMTLDKQQDETLALKYFTVNYSVVDLKSNVENIVANNDLVDSVLNEGINEFIPVVINSLKPEAQTVLNGLAHVYGDFLVEGMTLNQLIDLVNTSCSDVIGTWFIPGIGIFGF